MEQKGW
jgi:calcium-dependent protein kinase